MKLLFGEKILYLRLLSGNGSGLRCVWGTELKMPQAKLSPFFIVPARDRDLIVLIPSDPADPIIGIFWSRDKKKSERPKG